MATTAEQCIDRLTASFSHNIPECNLHAADGGHHSRATSVLVSNHLAADSFNVEGIRSQNTLRHPFVNEGVNRFLLPLQGCLPNTAQPGVGD